MAVELVNREAAEALIQEQIQKNILQGPITSSFVLQRATKLPNMTSNQTRMRVLDSLPLAYWVNGDTGRKKTTKQMWANVYVNAEELAVIVPVPDSVLADADIDILGEILPRVNEAFGAKVDAAILFDDERPEGWPQGVVTRAMIAGNNVAYDANKDLYDLILSENGVFDKVEAKGNAVSGVIADVRMKAKLRGLRDANKQPIFKSDVQGSSTYALDGVAMVFPDNGAFDSAITPMIAGDFSKLVYSIRQDVTVKILTEAVIQDPATGEIIYNLAQQDMTAIRVVFRLGYALPNYATRMDPDRIGCPFAYLEPATPVTSQNVTYTVKTGTGNDATPVAGAKVNINGANVVTGADGTAAFKLVAGTYPVTITADGFKKQADTLTVASAAVTKTITLVAK